MPTNIFNVEDFCSNCGNLRLRKGKLQCKAFLEFWPLWNEVSSACPARCPDPDKPEKISHKEIMEVLAEERKRGKGGGGGEKADRTNKTFGPARMKDNAIKWSWDEL